MSYSKAYCEARDALNDTPQTERERVLWDRLVEAFSDLYDARETIDDMVTAETHKRECDEIAEEREEYRERADKAEQALAELKAEIARDTPESATALREQRDAWMATANELREQVTRRENEIRELRRAAHNNAQNHVHVSALRATENNLWRAFDAAIAAMRERTPKKSSEGQPFTPAEGHELRAYGARFGVPHWIELANDAENGKFTHDARRALTAARRQWSRERG